MSRILIIDDDTMVCEALTDIVTRMGHEAASVHTLGDGLREGLSGGYDVVLLDVQMPDGNGIGVLPEILKTRCPPEVIILTGFGDPDGAELAIRNGAWDYLGKPSSDREIELSIKRALLFRKEKIAGKSWGALRRAGIIGSSSPMLASLDLLARAANSDANVLIMGETGTGKELFARAIHENSSREGKRLVVVDCAALPETLVESMLFGHEKGAFTGADKVREGLVRQADEGTLFLDEIGELPLNTQKQFLRVLETRCFRPLGAKNEAVSHFRLIAATNRDLDQMVKEGRFREDLYFRIQSITITLPPLRERFEDLRDLVPYHVDRLCRHHKMETKEFCPEFLKALAAYEWPGNVRELVNVLESALILTCNEPILLSQHLPVHIRALLARRSVRCPASYEPEPHCREVDIPGTPVPTGASGPESRRIGPAGDMEGIVDPEHFPGLLEFRKEMDRKYLQALMGLVDRDMEKACRVSGFSRARIYQLLKKYGV